METQKRRLESLNNAGEKLIVDAEYHNSTAKGIRDQTEDFDRCWGDVTTSVKKRKAMVSTKNENDGSSGFMIFILYP